MGVKRHVTYLDRTVSGEVLAGTEILGGWRELEQYLMLHCRKQNDSASR